MTQKKDFALKLEGCSKADIEKVESLAQSVGMRPTNGGRMDHELYLKFYKHPMAYQYVIDSFGEPVYSMPVDWSKIQEALGVSVEPKDGEVWITNGITFRSTGRKDTEFYTCVGISSGFHKRNKGEGYTANSDDPKSAIKANGLEESEHVKAEHANGYHWTGNELVEIPEYVECTDLGHDDSLFTHGNIYQINKDGVIVNNNGEPEIDWFDYTLSFTPSTLEAFEAQEAKKKGFTEADILKVSDAFRSETSKLRGRLLKKSERITDLEGENLGYKKLLEKRDKFINDLGKENEGFILKAKELDTTAKHWSDKYELIKKALADCESAYQDGAVKNIKLKINLESIKIDLDLESMKNDKLKCDLKEAKILCEDLSGKLHKEIERRCRYANEITEMTIELRNKK